MAGIGNGFNRSFGYNAPLVTLFVGEAYAEIRVRPPDSETSQAITPWTHRWLLSRESLEKGLQKVSDKFPERWAALCVATTAQRTVIKRKLYPSIALITTDGFEDALAYSSPPCTYSLNWSMERASLPIPTELIFGVTQPEASELNLILDKLKMMRVSGVAVALKGGQRTSSTERLIQQHLISSGMNPTLVASDFSGSFTERSRKVISHLLCHSYLSELKEKISSRLSQHIFAADITWVDGESLIFGHDPTPHFYFGLEDFTYSSPSGLLRLPNLTSWLSADPAGGPAWPSQEGGLDPGPMCLGRGQKPTWMDLLYITQQLPCAVGLEFVSYEKFHNRIMDSIKSLSRDPTAFIQGSLRLMHHAMTSMASLNSPGELKISGPWASLFEGHLREFLPQLTLIQGDDFELLNKLERTLSENDSH